MPKKSSGSPAFEERFLRATADGALSAIAEVGARAESLVQAWTEAGNAAAVLEVSERGQGAARKAARRALNVLRSRHVEIPVLHRVATLGGEVAPDVLEAWMMAPDSSGMQLFAVASRSPLGRSRVVFVFLHGAQGVARVENATMSQSQLKDYFAKVLPGSGYSATKVPVEWARFRIAAARRVHKDRGLPEPMGFATAASLLEPVSQEPPVHPFEEEGLEMADEDAVEMAAQSGLLHNIPEFRTWLPSNAAIEEMLAAVGQKLTPGEAPEPGALAEHLKAETEAATDRFFSPETREEIVRRMKDSALSALAREGEQRALEIAAVIKVIEKCGLITNPPREVPFLKAFFDKAVAVMAAQGGGRLRIPVPAVMNAPQESA